MRFIGLDLHKQSMEVCILCNRGNLIARHTVVCERFAIQEFARKHLKKSDRLAVEATTNTWAVAEILRPFVDKVVVGNPLQIKAIAQPKSKPTRSTPWSWPICSAATFYPKSGSRMPKRSN